MEKEIIEKDGFWISYNPNTDQGEETALCTHDQYYIVLGDARNAYREVETLDEAVKVFEVLQAEGMKVSPWSD